MAVVDNKGSDAGMGKTYSRLQRTETELDIGRDSVKVHGLIERSDTSSVGWAAMLDEHVHKASSSNFSCYTCWLPSPRCCTFH